ncbi:PQQ-dependent dehydrogenase, methanol/ethanol family [Oryzibacter oryziterrae]|uniref:PQQ-dependent dehydrogenase, methanol/ethanol family n=1 Tax=Oryzibacter oryziterrae TaxID=2766474 RepID=UPI001F2ABE6B|nr:PQQ-dependent dehydrogenase, methanol/ethanol family [Oryzibacter oryziterrae]
MQQTRSNHRCSSGVSLRRSTAVLALASALSALAPSANAAPAGNDWVTPAGDLEGTRFSTLKQIDTTNVDKLVEDFAVPTNTKGSHQGQPLVIGGIMYIVTPYPNRLIAVDTAQKGKVLWTFTPSQDEYAHGVACCDVVNRGAAYAAGKIVYNTLDDTTVAVDAKTGKQVWRHRHGRPETGETLTGAPLIVGNRVIVGNAGAELGIRGWVAGLDLATGKQVWRGYATGPDSDVLIGSDFKPFYSKDDGANLGTTTWPGTTWKQGGATSWAWLSYSPDSDLLYYGTANPGVWNPDMRVGSPSNPDPRRSDNKWSSAVFARDPQTGQAKWVYQLTPHDSWDYDSVNENTAVTLNIKGQDRKVIVHFDKNGFAYTMDQVTGEVLVAEPFGEVNWASGVDLTTGKPSVNADKIPHQGRVTSNICPSALGVKDWEPSAYSPSTKLFYIPAINACENLEPLKALYVVSAPVMSADLGVLPGPNGESGKFHMGELVAWDAATGTRKWGVTEQLPVYAGVLATDGGLVFYGTLDKHFKALDATTGKLLFDTKLECPVVGNPMTFMGKDGKQRVAIYSGVGWFAGGFAGGKCLAKPAGATSNGGLVHVFKLP